MTDEPSTPQPAKRGVGAPKGNTHNLKHGRRAQRYGLVLAKLGKRDARAYHDLCAIRRYLEGLLEKAGKLDGPARFKVQTVLRMEAMCRQVERDLREAKLEPEQRRTLAESVVRWTCQRDNVIATLLKGVKVDDLDWGKLTSGGIDEESAS